MCNKLHKNSKPIEESGYGWKLFRSVEKENNGKLQPAFCWTYGGYDTNPYEGVV
jgi:hypothetical protein